MRLTFLGTGSAMPVPGRAQSGILVETETASGTKRGAGTVDEPDAGCDTVRETAGEDDTRTVLIDCGSGILGRLTEAGAGYEAVDAVALTHHHLDHVADLLPLLKARWLAGAEPLSIVGPPGTESLLAELLEVHEYLRGRVSYECREVDPESGDEAIELPGLDAACHETVHADESHAYRLRPADRTAPTVVITGDTEADPELAAWGDDADVLVHDCSFPDDVDVSNHPTPASLGAALAGNSYGTVYLTHCYPHTEGRHGEMLRSLGERYDDAVEFARDGLVVEP